MRREEMRGVWMKEAKVRKNRMCKLKVSSEWKTSNAVISCLRTAISGTISSTTVPYVSAISIWSSSVNVAWTTSVTFAWTRCSIVNLASFPTKLTVLTIAMALSSSVMLRIPCPWSFIPIPNTWASTLTQSIPTRKTKALSRNNPKCVSSTRPLNSGRSHRTLRATRRSCSEATLFRTGNWGWYYSLFGKVMMGSSKVKQVLRWKSNPRRICRN